MQIDEFKIDRNKKVSLCTGVSCKGETIFQLQFEKFCRTDGNGKDVYSCYHQESFETELEARARVADIQNGNVKTFYNFKTVSETMEAAQQFGLCLIELGHSYEITKLFFGCLVESDGKKVMFTTKKK